MPCIACACVPCRRGSCDARRAGLAARQDLRRRRCYAVGRSRTTRRRSACRWSVARVGAAIPAGRPPICARKPLRTSLGGAPEVRPRATRASCRRRRVRCGRPRRLPVRPGRGPCAAGRRGPAGNNNRKRYCRTENPGGSGDACGTAKLRTSEVPPNVSPVVPLHQVQSQASHLADFSRGSEARQSIQLGPDASRADRSILYRSGCAPQLHRPLR